MEKNIIHFVKPIALFGITFVSVLYLSKSVSVAFVVSLIPLLLGWLAIMQSFAFGLAAMTFLAATAWAVTPMSLKEILQVHADRAIVEVNREITRN